MVANGTGARPENDKFKWFYGDLWAKFLDKKIVLDIYADYQRLHWIPGFHHSRNMIKGFVAYSTPALTAGVEAFVNHGKNDAVGVKVSGTDTLTANARGISLFVRSKISERRLGYFVRMDSYNPNSNYDDKMYTSYRGLSSAYEPNNKELFITAGLDYTPVKNVHFMPNVWYNKYKSQQSKAIGSANHDYDLVYRITFYYVYGR